MEEEAQGEVDEQRRGGTGLARTGTDATPLSLSLGGVGNEGCSVLHKGDRTAGGERRAEVSKENGFSSEH